MYLAVEDSMITAYDIFVQHVLKDQFVKLDAVDICEEVPQWMTNKGTLCHPKPIPREAAAWMRVSWPVLGGAEQL
jgi:hypothetical protein